MPSEPLIRSQACLCMGQDTTRAVPADGTRENSRRPLEFLRLPSDWTGGVL